MKMGDEEKNKETNDKRSNNKDNHRKDGSQRQNDGRPSRRRSESTRSNYSGSYVSWSNDSSHNSGMSSDDESRHGKRRRETKRPRKEKTRPGRVAKPRKRSNKQTSKQKKQQAKTFVHALEVEPQKALSITTIMSKASTITSSVTVDSNKLCHQQANSKPTRKLDKNERKRYVREIMKRMIYTRKTPDTQLHADGIPVTSHNTEESIEFDEEDDEVFDL